MKKKSIYLICSAAVIALIAYIGVGIFLGSVVRAGVNTIAQKITGTKVELAGATLSPLTGSGTLSGLTIGNPPGWNSERAFYLGKIHVSVKPFSIFGDHIVIDEISIDRPEITYETKIVSSNISDLLNNIESATGNGGKSQPTAKNGQPLKFEVRHFQLKNGTVRLGVGPAALPLPMPPVVLNDLGTAEGGITPSQLAFVVMRSITGSVVSATAHAAGKIGTTTGAAAAEGAKKAGEGLKKLFGGK